MRFAAETFLNDKNFGHFSANLAAASVTGEDFRVEVLLSQGNHPPFRQNKTRPHTTNPVVAGARFAFK